VAVEIVFETHLLTTDNRGGRGRGPVGWAAVRLAARRPAGPVAGRLAAEEALALERPVMTYVRAQLGDRFQRQLTRAARRWRRPSSGRRAGDQSPVASGHLQTSAVCAADSNRPDTRLRFRRQQRTLPQPAGARRRSTAGDRPSTLCSGLRPVPCPRPAQGCGRCPRRTPAVRPALAPWPQLRKHSGRAVVSGSGGHRVPVCGRHGTADGQQPQACGTRQRERVRTDTCGLWRVRAPTRQWPTLIPATVSAAACMSGRTQKHRVRRRPGSRAGGRLPDQHRS
jgi:hypothetical protein